MSMDILSLSSSSSSSSSQLCIPPPVIPEVFECVGFVIKNVENGNNAAFLQFLQSRVIEINNASYLLNMNTLVVCIYAYDW
jgi:hypothetical protein